LRFQFGTSSSQLESHGGRRYLPYVYTEQGIAMLAGVLKNELAIKISVNIIRAFVDMRQFLVSNGEMFKEIINVNQKLLEYDKKFEEVFKRLQKEESFKQKVFFEGQIYDAYSLIIEIIKQAKRKIVIIDNYVDYSILNMLVKKNKNVEAIILTSEKSNISKLDVEKFNKEYQNIKNSKIK
jgi:carbamoylphosphate synthase small subunit